MSDGDAQTKRPDLSNGIPIGEIGPDQPLFGTIGDAAVVLVKVDGDVRAFGATCTHYGGPLADGLVHAGTVRCPWHHACFSLEDGTVRGGPAFNPLPRREVEVRDGTVFVGGEMDRDPVAVEHTAPAPPDSVVIVGAGPAGTTATDTLLREGYEGSVTLIDPEADAPYDRPNLSKAFLSGEAPEQWLPIRSGDFYEAHGVHRLRSQVVKINLSLRQVHLNDGAVVSYGKLLFAPGSAPIALRIPGAELPHVHTLRSLDDCRSIIRGAESARRAVILGASFIGMEVACSLRERGLEVTVVAPEPVPLARALGKELGAFLRALHEENGVEFKLGRTASEILDDTVVVDDGTRVSAQLVVVGIGVKPRTKLADDAGLEVDDGVLVDARLRSSDPHVFAAGDVARYPDPRTGGRVRIEHWVVAGRQGRTAARNMLGREERFTDVPFFWTHHFGTSVTYVGHVEEWDGARLDGDCTEGSCAVTFTKDGRDLAFAARGRAKESLRHEAEWEEQPRPRSG